MLDKNDFYPRPPRGGRPFPLPPQLPERTHFYPRPPRGGRLGFPSIAYFATRFLSTPSARRATGRLFAVCESFQFLSTPSARRATRHRQSQLHSHNYFYPRPPRGGRRLPTRAGRLTPKFLSTPSARRATFGRASLRFTTAYFYPRPPRGGRPASAPQNRCCPPHFYPRPPRGGRPSRRPRRTTPTIFLSTPSARRATLSDFDCTELLLTFLSTPSARRATICRTSWRGHLLIFLSTPSARRATSQMQRFSGSQRYFYPRPPRGGRPGTAISSLSPYIFLSTPSARRATGRGGYFALDTEISIHALREEGDGSFRFECKQMQNISIHALREEGDVTLEQRRKVFKISIHALREEGDIFSSDFQARKGISIHALREEGDSPLLIAPLHSTSFLSTPSARRATGDP